MEENLSRLHHLNLSRLHDLNKRVAEARKRVEYLKKKRNALYLRKRTVDVQTWMLNNLVDDACRVCRRCFICLSLIHSPHTGLTLTQHRPFVGPTPPSNQPRISRWSSAYTNSWDLHNGYSCQYLTVRALSAFEHLLITAHEHMLIRS